MSETVGDSRFTVKPAPRKLEEVRLVPDDTEQLNDNLALFDDEIERRPPVRTVLLIITQNLDKFKCSKTLVFVV